MQARVHSWALVAPGACLGPGCEVAAFGVVRDGVTLGARCVVGEHAVLGGDPQDLGFDPRVTSGVLIGADCRFREGSTVHRSAQLNGRTRLGERVYLMTHSHIGHDCQVGDDVVLASGALLGGHVTVGSHVFVGGNAAVHQQVRLGEGAMIAGGGRIAHDVPPFVLAEGYSRAAGLNVVGLQRRGLGGEVLADLKRCYRAVLIAPGKAAENAARHQARTPQGEAFLAFFADSHRGFVKSIAKRSY